MTERRPTSKFFIGCLAIGAVSVALVACDTNDGTRLKTPTAATTLPPPETTVPSSEPIGSVVVPPPPPEPSEIGIQVFAPWAEEGSIDPIYTCDGVDVSPPISWSGVTETATELAISLVDESAIEDGRPFVHWVMAGIDPTTGRIDEGTTPPGAITALNFFGNIGYDGPCPPAGELHTYRLTLYALGQQIEVADGAPATEFLDTILAIAIESASTLVTATR